MAAAKGAAGGLGERMTPCCFCLALEKKSRKKKAPVTPPQLLVQDVETTGRQMEDCVAQLLAEELELSGTPPLPASRIFKEELEKSRRGLRPPGGKQNFLWEGSALTGAWALESFYTASLVPPLVPQWPAEVCSLPSWHGWAQERGWRQKVGGRWEGGEAKEHRVWSSVFSLQQPDGSPGRNRETTGSQVCYVPGEFKMQSPRAFSRTAYDLLVMGGRNQTGLCRCLELVLTRLKQFRRY